MKSAAKFVLLGCLLLNMTMGFYICRLRQVNKSRIPISDQFNLVKNSIYQDLPIAKDDIVFIGTSLTECFPLGEFFNDPRIKNRGIQGNDSRHIVQRVKCIIEGHPAKLFLEMGVNDLLDGILENELLSNFSKVIDLANKNDVPIIVCSMLPYGMRYGSNNPVVRDVNKHLLDICNTKGCRYIDMFSSVVKNGGLDSTLTVDGIHLNYKGYCIWKAGIDKYIQ